MKFRLAKQSDCRQLAEVYIACSGEDEAEAEGFALKLGRRFLQQYFRVLLMEAGSVVVCAVDDNDPNRVLGFTSGSLDAGESMKSFRKHRVRLLLAASAALVCRPQMIFGLLRRYKATSADNAAADGGEQYVIGSGARLTYWGMLPSSRSGPAGLALLQKWLKVMQLLGARDIRAELNRGNTRAQRVHQMFGAETVKEFVTPEGKERVILKYP